MRGTVPGDHEGEAGPAAAQAHQKPGQDEPIDEVDGIEPVRAGTGFVRDGERKADEERGHQEPAVGGAEGRKAHQYRGKDDQAEDRLLEDARREPAGEPWPRALLRRDEGWERRTDQDASQGKTDGNGEQCEPPVAQAAAQRRTPRPDSQPPRGTEAHAEKNDEGEAGCAQQLNQRIGGTELPGCNAS